MCEKRIQNSRSNGPSVTKRSGQIGQKIWPMVENPEKRLDYDRSEQRPIGPNCLRGDEQQNVFFHQSNKVIAAEMIGSRQNFCPILRVNKTVCPTIWAKNLLRLSGEDEKEDLLMDGWPMGDSYFY